jgi:hypothetical protein
VDPYAHHRVPGVSAAQERYWPLSHNLTLASVEVRVAAGRLLVARQQMDEFCAAHEGEEFRMFHPADIAAMASSEIEPLFPAEAR